MPIKIKYYNPTDTLRFKAYDLIREKGAMLRAIAMVTQNLETGEFEFKSAKSERLKEQRERFIERIYKAHLDGKEYLRALDVLSSVIAGRTEDNAKGETLINHYKDFLKEYPTNPKPLKPTLRKLKQQRQSL